MKSPPYLLLYDRDCGICSAVSRWIRTLDWRGRIRLQSIQSSRNILVGIPEDRMLDALHVVSPDGHVTTGGDAVPNLNGSFPSFPFPMSSCRSRFDPRSPTESFR